MKYLSDQSPLRKYMYLYIAYPIRSIAPLPSFVFVIFKYLIPSIFFSLVLTNRHCQQLSFKIRNNKQFVIYNKIDIIDRITIIMVVI